MNSTLYLKKIDKAIDQTMNKHSNTFNLEYFINYIITKVNMRTSNEEISSGMENILIKLIQSGFGTTVKTYCYYVIANFNHEFSSQFFSLISSELHNDAKTFEIFDPNINALRNYLVLNEKEIIDNLSLLEQIFKIKNVQIDFIINSFYFSNFPIVLLNIFNKISYDEYRTYKEFLKKFYLELGKLLFEQSVQDGAFLNLLKILQKIILKFQCFPQISTKEKIINSIIVPLAEYLVSNINELLDLIQSFDHKLLSQSLNFPIALYKIYNFFRDLNNPNKKFERAFHRYMSFLFKENRNIVDPDIYSEFVKTICEFKIIEININPQYYGTEIIENISKFLELSDHFDKSTWFDSNMKILSKLMDFVDYNEVFDITVILLSETKNIGNLNDRMLTIFNLFIRLIFLAINYSSFFEKDSLILCLFKHNWFVLLVNKPKVDEKESRWRNDVFIGLIEALFYVKKYILKNGQIKKFIILIKICQDIIDVCSKILDWSDEGEAFKMYFLILEETCLFFEDKFFNYIFKGNDDFEKMKGILDGTLMEISKRFLNVNWDALSFANENSKYRSLLLLSKFLNINESSAINNLLEVIFLRLNDIPFDNKNEKFIEEIIQSCLFLGIRANFKIREKIISSIAEFIEKLNQKKEGDKHIISNIKSFAENIMNYLLDNKIQPQIQLNSDTIDKLTNEFYLIIPKDIENNIEKKKESFNNLYLINLCENSIDVIESYLNDNSSVYLDYFKKYFYFPMLEFNNDNCHMLIKSNGKYIFSDWKLITGISDPVHIYYMFKIDIETREIELFIKNFNSTSVVLNNINFNIYFSENLMIYNESNLSMNYSPYVNSKQFSNELLSPFSYFDFSLKFYSNLFEKNNISVDCSFDMITDQKNRFKLNSECFYIPLIDFLLPDNFSLYEIKTFDIFFNTLEYAFTCKCYTSYNPNELKNKLSQKITLVEFKSKNFLYNKEKEILDSIKKKQFPEFLQENNNDINYFNNPYENNSSSTFKIKLCAYCIYNFWIYIIIIGDYNEQHTKSILNIEIRTNDLSALNILSREKNCFFNELLGDNIKFY